MIQNFGGDCLNHTTQWFELNKYGLNDTTELAVWFESQQTAQSKPPQTQTIYAGVIQTISV